MFVEEVLCLWRRCYVFRRVLMFVKEVSYPLRRFYVCREGPMFLEAVYCSIVWSCPGFTADVNNSLIQFMLSVPELFCFN